MIKRKATPLSKRDMPTWVRNNPKAYGVDWDSLPEDRELASYTDDEARDAIYRSLDYLKNENKNYTVISIDEVSPGFFRIYESSLGMVLGTFSLEDVRKYLESSVKYGDNFEKSDILVDFIFSKAPVIENWLYT